MRKKNVFFCLAMAAILLVDDGFSAMAQTAPVASTARTVAYVIQNHSPTATLVAMDGNGTPQSPYLITSKAQLNDIRNNLSASYRLQNDIVFDAADFASGGAFYNDGQGFLPIGTQAHPFVGGFDGNSHTIRGLVGGLIGFMAGGSITNLGLEASNIHAIYTQNTWAAGGIVHTMNGGLIDNCYNAGSVSTIVADITSRGYTGGIVGEFASGIISNCNNVGSVTANIQCVSTAYLSFACTGGIVGYMSGGTIIACTNSSDTLFAGNTGANSGTNSIYIGGIAGYMSGGSIADSSNAGDLAGNDDNSFVCAGGIAGSVSFATIQRSYNTGCIGAVSQSSTIDCLAGGIVGSLNNEGVLMYVCNGGSVTATGLDPQTGAGGIVGWTSMGSTIDNSYNSGSVSASNSTDRSSAGGIASRASMGGSISHSYNVGSVSAQGGLPPYVGGILGCLATSNNTVNNCYYLNRIEKGVGSGTDTALPATSEQLREQWTFNGFAFSTIWTMDGNTTYFYPELQQVPVQGNFVTSIVIANQEVTLEQGQSLQMNAVTQPDDADDRSVQWTVITGTGGATLSQRGLLTANKPGTVTVIAAANDASGCYDIRQMQILGNCTVSFDVQSGNAVASQTVRSNDLLARPTDPTRVGADFVGWYKDAACTTTWDFAADRVTTDTTLYAKWNINYYVITFDSQGGSAVASQNVAPNGHATPPTNPTRPGATFQAWYKDANYTSLWDFAADAVTATTTLYAKWTINYYVIPFDSQGGSAVASQNIPPYGRLTRPANPTKAGHRFIDWYKEAGCVNKWDFSTTVTSQITLYAKWIKETYGVTFNSRGGSAVDYQDIPYDTKLTRPTDPICSGFIFVGWYKEEACINQWNFATDTVTTSIELYAKWIDEPSGQFTVSGGTGYIYSGDTHTLTISEAGAYTLSMNAVAQTTRDSIVVSASDGPVSLTLNNVNIDVSGYSDGNGCALRIQGMSNVELTLTGTNVLKSGYQGSGIYVSYDAVLTIGGSGSLEATGGSAGIGGLNRFSDVNGAVGGTITINSGTVTAAGGSGAGIGGGYQGPASRITISGGTISATSSGGAGIGGGCNGFGGTIVINDGTVTATGGRYSAGIGGGGTEGNGGSIAINGGTITAVGGEGGGAGIGGGTNANGNSVDITNGMISAIGGNDGGAGIGSGSNGIYSGSINISDGIVHAAGGNGGAGIGSGYKSHCDRVTISGGMVIAQGGNRSAGIGGANTPGGTVSISGGIILATGGYSGAGIGGGYSGSGGSTYISGGSVLAQGGTDAQDIGHGAASTVSGILKSHEVQGVDVFKTTVILRGITAATTIKAVTTNAGYPYKTSGMCTDTAGRAYLYLPQNTITADVQTPSARYIGSVTTLHTGTATGTLSIGHIVNFQSDGTIYATKAVPTGASIAADWPAKPSKPGYTFAGWYTGADSPFVQNTPVTSDMIVSAHWNTNSYTVAFNLGGSGVSNPNRLTAYTYGSGAVTLSTPARTGYLFGGWYANPSFSGAASTSVNDALASGYANGDTITLYAKWIINSYPVSFNSQGGSTVSTQNIPHSGLVPRPADPNWAGHTFLGWYKETSCIHAWDFSVDTVDATTTLFAKWQTTTYRVCFYNEGAEHAIVTAKYSDKISMPAQPKRTGYTFVGWYKEPECINPWSFFSDTVTADIGLYAKWSINTYSVTFDGRGGGITSGTTAAYGTSIPAPRDPMRPTYTFTGWFQNAACTVPWSFATNTVTDDIILYAGWTAQPKSSLLRSIALSCGSLSRSFGSAVTSYTINLGEYDNAVTLTPIKEYDDAAMTIDRKALPAKTLALANGKTASMVVKVTWNRKTTTYKLKIVRAKSTANTLAALMATAGTWSQPFDPSVGNYTLTLPSTVSKVTLKATRASSLAVVSPVSKAITVKNGKPVKVAFKVKAQSGATRVYTVTIVRP